MSARAALGLIAVGLAAAVLWLAFATQPTLPDYRRHREGWSGDFRSYYLPNAQYAGERLAAGEWPLWNPHQALGGPMLATAQVGALYPPNWLHAWLPTDRAFVVLAFLHLVLAACSAGLLVTAFGGPFAGALFGGFVYASSPNVIASIYSPPLLYAAAWAPLLLYAVDRIIDRATPRRVVGLSVVVGMMLLVGWPYAFAMTAFAAALYGGGLLFARGVRERRLPWRAVLALVLGVAAGCMLAAPQWLPTSELLARSCRALGSVVEGQAVFVKRPHDPLLIWRALLRFGYNDGVPGFIALALACLALLLPGRGRARIAGLLAIGALALIVSFPLHAPLYGWLRELPVLGDFRFPFRYRFLTNLALAAAAGVGVAHVLRLLAPRPRLASATVAAAFVAFAFTVTWPLLHSTRPFPRSVSAAPSIADDLRESGVELPEGGHQRIYWAGLARKRGRDRAFDVLYDMEPMTLARTAELVTFFETGRPSTLRTPPHKLGGESRDGDWVSAPFYGYLGIPMNGDRARLLDLLSARWIVTPSPPGWLDDRYRRISAPDAELAVFENPHALPRAYRVPGAFRAPEGLGRALRGMLGDAFDPKRHVLLESPPRRLLRSAAARLRDRQATVSIERYDEESVALRTNGARPGVVVLTDAWFPGWLATVDGKQAPLLRANLAFRGVVVPAGEHVVEMHYRPASRRRGLWLAAVAVVGLGVAWFRPSQVVGAGLLDDA
ncbi:MAG: YfhO family protein [Deltaproteobacteria bacterium]|nr:YfhO family protein [Deltaproteobacteria bacterium]